MAPSLHRIRQAATKKRKARVDGAPADPAKKRATIKIVKSTEAGEASGRNGAKRAEAREASGRNEAEERERPRSPSPAPPPSPIDLTGSSSGQETEVPPPPSAIPEAEPTISATGPIPEVALSNGGAGAESLRVEAPVEAPVASNPVPMATEATEEDEADVPSFQLILLHHSRWAERTMA